MTLSGVGPEVCNAILIICRVSNRHIEPVPGAATDVHNGTSTLKI
jgi:hypothetical protein